jgi:hypothetical protein
MRLHIPAALHEAGHSLHKKTVPAIAALTVLLAATSLGNHAWTKYGLAVATTFSALVSLTACLAKAPNPFVAVGIIAPAIVLIVTAFADLGRDRNDKLVILFAIMAALPVVVVLIAAVGATGKTRFERPSQKFLGALDVLGLYGLLLAVGFGAVVWTHSTEGLVDGLRKALAGS